MFHVKHFWFTAFHTDMARKTPKTAEIARDQPKIGQKSAIHWPYIGQAEPFVH
jgi:hypothetical protein